MKHIALFVCVLLCSPSRADDPAPDAGKALEGEWVLETIDLGKEAPKAEQESANKRFVGKMHLRFRDGTLLITAPDGPKDAKPSSYRLTAGGAANGIYVTPPADDGKAKEYPFGLYRLDKGKLSLCINTHKTATKLPGKFEPAEEDQASGDTTAVLVFKRVKNEK